MFTVLSACTKDQGTVVFVGSRDECVEYLEAEGYDEATDRLLECDDDSLLVGERVYIRGDRAEPGEYVRMAWGIR